MTDQATQATPVEQWNAFWFNPAPLKRLALLRLVASLGAIWFFANFTADALAWFGPGGRLSIDTTTHLTGKSLVLPSPLRWTTASALVVGLPWIGLGLSVALLCGLATRLTAPLTLAFFLFHIHRGPMLAGLLEIPLAMLLLYVCLEPGGGAPAWNWRDASGESRLARVAWRLAQIHFCGLLLAMGFQMLGGSEVWWNGEGAWWLIASNQTRLLDLSLLHDNQLITNLIAHWGVAFSLLFAPLIWRPLLRRWLLRAGAAWWLFVALTTGQVAFSVLMVATGWSLFAPSAD